MRKGTLVDIRLPSMIIRDLRDEMNSIYRNYTKSDEYLSKSHYPKFMKFFRKSFDLLEEVAEEIRILEIKQITVLKKTKKKLESYKQQYKNHPNKATAFRNIDKLLNELEHIKEKIDEGTHISLKEEGYVHGYLNKE